MIVSIHHSCHWLNFFILRNFRNRISNQLCMIQLFTFGIYEKPDQQCSYFKLFIWRSIFISFWFNIHVHVYTNLEYIFIIESCFKENKTLNLQDSRLGWNFAIKEFFDSINAHDKKKQKQMLLACRSVYTSILYSYFENWNMMQFFKS